MALYSLANQAGALFRAALNTYLGKLQGNNYGTTDPASASESTPGMFWVDTNGAAPVIKMRNPANDAWVTIGTLGDAFSVAGGLPQPVLLERTVLASAAATIDATWDNAGLDHVVLKLQNFTPVTNSQPLFMRTTNDTGSSWDSGASDYGYRREQTNLGATASEATVGQTAAFIGLTSSISNDASGGGAEMTIEFANAGIAKHTKMRWTGSFYIGTSSIETGVIGWGKRNVAEIVDGAQFYVGSGDIAAGAILSVWGYPSA